MIGRAAMIAVLTIGGFALAQDPATHPTATATTATTTSTTTSTPTDKVKVTFITVPMKKAFVYWGKRRLGMIAPRQPLVIERPRDSGPLDVMVRAEGYLPVQTRAYTFADTKVAVKLTPPDQKNTLLGYREEVPAPDAGVPSADGGVPPPPPGAFAPAR
jgi:hypothetical protein